MKKKKMKQKKKIRMIILFFLLGLTFISSGYAIFSKSISINGSARTSDYYTNNKLQINLTQTSGKYTVGGTSRITFQNEVYDGINNLSAYFTKNDNTTQNRSNTFRINFTNPYRLNITNVTVARVVVSGTFNSSSVTVSRTTITPNQAANFRLTTSHKNSNIGSGQIRVTLTGRVNNVVKYFYYTVYISWKKEI